MKNVFKSALGLFCAGVIASSTIAGTSAAALSSVTANPGTVSAQAADPVSQASDLVAKAVAETLDLAYATAVEIANIMHQFGLDSFIPSALTPYIHPGKNYTGVAYYNYKGETAWWAFKNGEVQPRANGFYDNDYGTWYVRNGKVDSSATGLVLNSGYRWYVLEGKLQKNYTGMVTYKGIRYKVTNGKVTGGSTQVETDAVKVLNSVGWDFKKAYYWTINNIRYNKYIVPVDGSYGVSNYAIYGFEKKTGNCYTFSCSVYYLGRMCNEDIHVIKGTVPHVGGTQGAHSWNEVKRNGKTYVLDAQYEQQWRNKGRHPYSGWLFTYGTRGSLVYHKQSTLA